jgi:uncharacterized protein YegL
MKAKQLFTSALVIAVVALMVAAIPSHTVPALAQSTCGPVDVVFLIDDTGSMGGAISNIKTDVASLVNQVIAAAEGDYQMGLVTFKDDVVVREDLAAGNADPIRAAILNLEASFGMDIPEASDEALNTAINRLPAAGRPQTGDFNGIWRAPATKIAILITDAPPGGFDDACTPGVDDVNAHTRATEAAAADILISAVYVPTGGSEGASNDRALPAAPMSCDARAVMQDYAATTGGVFVETSPDGAGTATAISDIIAGCGTPTTPTPAPTPIPEPTTILLLGTGAASLAAYIRKRRQA